MNTNNFNIEVTYLKKSSYQGKINRDETTLKNMQECEIGDKFLTVYYKKNIENCVEGDLVAIKVPVEDVIDIKVYKR